MRGDVTVFLSNMLGRLRHRRQTLYGLRTGVARLPRRGGDESPCRVFSYHRCCAIGETGGASGIAAPSWRGSDAPKCTPPGPLITAWP